MFGSLFTLFFIFMMISVILGVTRAGRSRLGDGGYPPQQQLNPPPGAAPFGQWGGGYGQQPVGLQPMGFTQRPAYDPAAMQAMAPAARQAIDHDITSFGEELRDLDLEVVGRPLDDAAQADYASALDAYDGAKQQLQAARTNADVKRIAQIMEGGRYAVACVRARVNGQPVPERRAPCFFDPSHGVSIANVTWAPPGGAAREVPACAADAQRVRTGIDPSIRMVQGGHGQVPYWEDQQHAAWAQGYYGRYGADPALRSITHGALMIGGFSLLMGLLDD